MKEESLKVQLKAADEKELVELVNGVTEQIRNGRQQIIQLIFSSGINRFISLKYHPISRLGPNIPKKNFITREIYKFGFLQKKAQFKAPIFYFCLP